MHATFSSEYNSAPRKHSICESQMYLCVKFALQESLNFELHILTYFMFLLWRTLLLIFYSLPYFFPLFCEPSRMYQDANVYCKVSVYTVSLRMLGASTLAFKFFFYYLQIYEVKRDIEHVSLPGSVTGI